jgi:hypothetical protein
MIKKKIMEFEIRLIKLNRHIAYKNPDQTIICYNRLKEAYQKILDSDIALDQKHFTYQTLLRAHNNLCPKDFKSFDLSDINLKTAQIAVLASILLLPSIILFIGPEVTGMMVSESPSFNPLPIFQIGLILLPIIAVILKKIKN